MICQQTWKEKEQPLLLVLSAGGGLGVAPAVDAWSDLIRFGA
jgi:hypothetical protein